MVPRRDRLGTGSQSPSLGLLLPERGCVRESWDKLISLGRHASSSQLWKQGALVLPLHCLPNPRKSVPRVTKDGDNSPVQRGRPRTWCCLYRTWLSAGSDGGGNPEIDRTGSLMSHLQEITKPSTSVLSVYFWPSVHNAVSTSLWL